MPRTTAWRLAMKQASQRGGTLTLKTIAARCKPLILPLRIANCILIFALLKRLESCDDSNPEPKLNLMDRGTPTFSFLHSKVASRFQELFVAGKRWYEGDVRATASWQGDQHRDNANPEGIEKRRQ